MLLMKFFRILKSLIHPSSRWRKQTDYQTVAYGGDTSCMARQRQSQVETAMPQTRPCQNTIFESQIYKSLKEALSRKPAASAVGVAGKHVQPHRGCAL